MTKYESKLSFVFGVLSFNMHFMEYGLSEEQARLNSNSGQSPR